MSQKFAQTYKAEQNIFDNVFLAEHSFSWVIATSGAAISKPWYPKQVDASRELLLRRPYYGVFYEYAWEMSFRRSDDENFKFALEPKSFQEGKDNQIYMSVNCVVPNLSPAFELITHDLAKNVKGKWVVAKIPAVHLVPPGNVQNFYELEFLIKVKVAWKADMPVRSNQVFSTQLNADIELLYGDRETTDVTFVLDDKTEVRAHKLIVKARSPVFRKMFQNDTPKSKVTQVFINDMHTEIFQELVRYMYTEKVPSTDNLADLMVAAEKYELRQLVDFCKGKLNQTVTYRQIFSV